MSKRLEGGLKRETTTEMAFPSFLSLIVPSRNPIQRLTDAGEAALSDIR